MGDRLVVAHDPSARYAGTSPRCAWGGMLPSTCVEDALIWLVERAVDALVQRLHFLAHHLGAILQEQLLIAPLALATCVLALVGLRVPREVNPARRQIAVLAAAAGAALFFSVTWNPDLGPRQDWDLLSLPGIPLSLLAGALLATRWPRSDDTERPYTRTLTYVGSVLVAASAWHALSWLLANALGLG